MIINVQSKTEMSGLYLVYVGSTHNEKDGIFGISHLMEHLFFKNAKDLEKQFEKYGMTTNATTSNNEVVFYLTGIEEYISKFRDEYLERMTTFNVTDEDFQKERDVVIEEYWNGFNNQEEAHWRNLVRKKFGHYSAIGAIDDLKRITLDDCKEYLKVQFDKPDKIINVSKDYSLDWKNGFQKHESDTYIVFENYDFPIEKTPIFEDKTSIINCLPVYGDFAHISFLCRMLCYGLQSPLFKRLREDKGLIYGVLCGLNRMSNTTGMITIETLTGNDNVNEVQSTIAEVMGDVSCWLNDERFETAKISFEVEGKTSEINRYKDVDKYITPYGWNPDSILDDVDLNKAKDVAGKYFQFDKWYKSEDKKEFIVKI